ncbi:hypothetical protein QTP88_024972 [Uroleucon formosanum]
MEISLTNDKTIKCKLYKTIDPNRIVMRNQIEKWTSLEVCRMSTLPYAGPAFVVDQPFHESTPKAISIAYCDLLKLGLAKYYDNLAAGHDSYEDHLNFLQFLFEATRKYSLKFTKNKSKTDQTHKGGQAVTIYKILSTLQKLRSLLRFVNVLRWYRSHFVFIPRPLTNILKKKTNTNNYFYLFLTAFRQKVSITVETGTSYKVLGTYLFQIHDSSNTYINKYASRTLKDPEKPVHWAITEKCCLYLVGQTFKLVTNNYSTSYIVNKAKLNRKLPDLLVGKPNILADHLSRYSQPISDENQWLTIINSQNDKLVQAQQADSFCQQINKKIKSTENIVHILQIIRMYKFENNTLIDVNVETECEVPRIFIPFPYRKTILRHFYDNTGHFDIKETASRIRVRYWWSSMI